MIFMNRENVKLILIIYFRYEISMYYSIYKNFLNFFPNYNYSNQLEIIVNPYSTNNLVDLAYYGDNNYYMMFVMMILFLFIFNIVVSVIYISKINNKFKRQLSIYYEKLTKIQYEKKIIKKKYDNLMISINKINKISSIDDRLAKKMCLITSELQNCNKRTII